MGSRMIKRLTQVTIATSILAIPGWADSPVPARNQGTSLGLGAGVTLMNTKVRFGFQGANASPVYYNNSSDATITLLARRYEPTLIGWPMFVGGEIGFLPNSHIHNEKPFINGTTLGFDLRQYGYLRVNAGFQLFQCERWDFWGLLGAQATGFHFTDIVRIPGSTAIPPSTIYNTVAFGPTVGLEGRFTTNGLFGESKVATDFVVGWTGAHFNGISVTRPTNYSLFFTGRWQHEFRAGFNFRF